MKLSKIETAWFEYPDDPDGARLKIKHLLAGDLNDIQDQVHQEEVEFKKDLQGNLEPSIKTTIRQKIGEELTVCAAIADWENVMDADGVPLACTDENKIRVCRELPEPAWRDFVKFIGECRAALSEQVAAQEAAALGN